MLIQPGTENRNVFFPCEYEGLFCESFNCRMPARWFIGKPQSPISSAFKLCDACVAEMLTYLPLDIARFAKEGLQRHGYQVKTPLEVEKEQKLQAQAVWKEESKDTNSEKVDSVKEESENPFSSEIKMEEVNSKVSSRKRIVKKAAGRKTAKGQKGGRSRRV